MFGLGPTELVILGVLALLFIGPKKLPELARGLGRSLREFQKAKDEFQTEFDDVKDSAENSAEQTQKMVAAEQNIEQNPQDPEHKTTEAPPSGQMPHATPTPEADESKDRESEKK